MEGWESKTGVNHLNRAHCPMLQVAKVLPLFLLSFSDVPMRMALPQWHVVLAAAWLGSKVEMGLLVPACEISVFSGFVMDVERR